MEKEQKKSNKEILEGKPTEEDVIWLTYNDGFVTFSNNEPEFNNEEDDFEFEKDNKLLISPAIGAIMFDAMPLSDDEPLTQGSVKLKLSIKKSSLQYFLQ